MGLAQDHVHGILVDGLPSGLALEGVHQVHQRGVLHVLAERGHERGITELGPYVLDFLEEHHHQLVEGDLLLALVAQGHVDGALETLEVGHHGAHHATGQSAAYQKRRADVVVRLDEHAQKIVDECLGESSGLHIGVHVDVLYEESGILQHGLDRDNVRMNLTPGKRLHGHVQIVGTGAGHLQHGGF